MMSTTAPRIIVSHPTKQGNIYDRPLAAQKVGLEVRFLTGFYGATVPAWLRLPGRVMPGYRRQLQALAVKRVHPELAPASVEMVSSPLIEMVKMRFGRLAHYQNEAHDRAAARWLATHPFAAVGGVFHGFQETCKRSLLAARARGLTTLLEVTSPPISLEDIDRAEGLSPEFRAELRRENERKRTQIFHEVSLADRVIVQSEFSAALLEAGGVSRDRIVQVDLGVDTVAFAPGQKQESTGKPLQVLFVGQIGFRKGFDLLAQAVRQLGTARVNLKAAGHVYDEVGRECLRANPDIQYLGVVPDRDLPGLYQQADILVIPSRSEGGCNVVMEALASGCPCLVSEGAISVVEHEQDGWVVPNEDVPALVETLARAAADRGKLSALRRAAREKACRHSWAKFHERLGELYRVTA